MKGRRRCVRSIGMQAPSSSPATRPDDIQLTIIPHSGAGNEMNPVRQLQLLSSMRPEMLTERQQAQAVKCAEHRFIFGNRCRACLAKGNEHLVDSVNLLDLLNNRFNAKDEAL